MPVTESVLLLDVFVTFSPMIDNLDVAASNVIGGVDSASITLELAS